MDRDGVRSGSNMPQDMAAATSAAQEPELQVFQSKTRQLLVCDIQEISLTMYLDSVRKVLGGMFRENSIETCILSMVKQITSPGWMHETSARAWCTGKTQTDWVEREVGGGIGMGNTCNSMTDSCQFMTKTTK